MLCLQNGLPSLKNELKNYLVKKALEGLFKKLAFLSWGPFGFITEFIVRHIISNLIDEGMVLAMCAYIEWDVDHQVQSLNDIVEQIKEKTKQQNLTKEQRDEYDKKLSQAGSDLIKFNRLRVKSSK